MESVFSMNETNKINICFSCSLLVFWDFRTQSLICAVGPVQKWRSKKHSKKKNQETGLNYEVMLSEEIALTYNYNYMQFSLFNIECFSVIQDFIGYIIRW